MLNVGDQFEGFGGSKHPLIASRDFATGAKQKKPTANLVIRFTGAMRVQDMGSDIHDADFWRFVCRCINGGEEATAEIEIPAGEEG
jgi:hypothetical protein